VFDELVIFIDRSAETIDQEGEGKGTEVGLYLAEGVCSGRWYDSDA